MIKNIFLFSLFVIFLVLSGCKNDTNDDKLKESNPEPITVISKTLPLADPYILLHDSIYYIYGTAVENGFDVYSSKDLEHWVRASNLSLSQANSYGEKFFWAPEVYYIKKEKKFYMFYSADEHICVATSSSPFGPWKKFEGNPILHKYSELEGVGHGAPFYDKDGNLHYVFHAHNSPTKVHPRNTFIVDMSIQKGVISMDRNLIRPMVVDRYPKNK